MATPTRRAALYVRVSTSDRGRPFRTSYNPPGGRWAAWLGRSRVYRDEGIQRQDKRPRRQNQPEVRRMSATLHPLSTYSARKHHRHSHLHFFALRLSQQVMKFRSHRLPHIGCDGKKFGTC